MSHELDFNAALRLARALTLIENFPRFEEAINATAEDLVRWCQGAIIDKKPWPPEAQAEWLVREARLRFSKWPSTAEFYALFRSRFEPELTKPPELDLGPKPEIECKRCNDFGYRQTPQGFVWCDCSEAQFEKQRHPDFVDLLNRDKHRLQ